MQANNEKNVTWIRYIFRDRIRQQYIIKLFSEYWDIVFDIPIDRVIGDYGLDANEFRKAIAEKYDIALAENLLSISIVDIVDAVYGHVAKNIIELVIDFISDVYDILFVVRDRQSYISKIDYKINVEIENLYFEYQKRLLDVILKY